MPDLVVDTSYWVAARVPTDQYHVQATEFFDDVRGEQHKFHLPYSVLVETCRVLIRQARVARTSPMAEVTRVRAIFSDWERGGQVTWYTLDMARAESAILVLLQRDLKLGDILVLALALQLGYPLRSFDGDLEEAYQDIQQFYRRTPS